MSFLSFAAFTTGFLAAGEQPRPNVLLILADDVGVEAFGSYGGTSYATPHLDALAREGLRFTHCYSQPLCTPSRVKLMTGKSNLRNYANFSILDPEERTFAHLAQGAGYATTVAGKWQLFGAEGYGDWTGRGTTPHGAGFDSSCLWQVTTRPPRYWDPVLEVNGELRDPAVGAFGPDLFVDHLLEFMAEERDGPFLAYFPMALVHSPFVHTPLTRTSGTAETDRGTKAERFGEMVRHMDTLVGRLVAGLEALGQLERTLILFTGDNGTSRGIRSMRNGREVKGGKSLPTDAGTHVPLIASWPGHTAPGGVCDDLVDFSDFLPTIAGVMSVALPEGQVCDGKSFLPQLLGEPGTPREHITIYSNPRPEKSEQNPRALFARDRRFKLYDDGRLYDCVADALEARPLSPVDADSAAQAARRILQRALDDLPPEPEHLRPAIDARTPRHVVVILADDMGLASLHAEHGGSGLPTPHLDRLAAQGLSFTDAHSGSAVCSPTRYGLLTGRYAWRTRMKSGIVAKWGPPLIAEDRMTLADVAHTAGLASACIGKWHLGWRWPKREGGTTSTPGEIDYGQPLGGGALEAGFDHYFGDDVPNWPPYVWIEDDRALATPSGHMEEDGANGVRAGPMTPGWSLEAVLPELTTRCVQFIRDRAKAEERFFLYFAMTSPHTPINPSEEFRGKSGVSPYADFLLETDWSVGQVLGALDDCGLSEDTLVIFTADNGTSPKADFASLSAGGVDLRAGWRGHKADVWEGGHRVPFLVRWPGVVEPGTRSVEPIALTDVMATVADALGVKLGVNAAEDSVSLLPVLAGSNNEAPLHDAIINHSSSGKFALRTARWKLCFCPGSGGWSEPRGAKQADVLGLPSVQLYDMDADPEEQHNLADKMPERVEALTGLLREVVERSPLDGPSWWSRLPWPAAVTAE